MTTVTGDQVRPTGRGPMVRLARLLGCTEGQAYTIMLAMVLTLVAAFVGIPPTLRGVAVPGKASRPGTISAPTPGAGTRPVGTPVAPPIQVPAGPFTGIPPVASPGPSSPPTMPILPATGFGPAGVAARVGNPGAPDGVAVDGEGRLYVTTNNGVLRGGEGPSKVLRYGPDGKLQRELIVKGQDAARFGGLTGVIVAPGGGVLVLDESPARVLRVDLDRGNQSTYAVLADLPACGATASSNRCEPGTDDRPRPRAMALDDDATLFVTDSGQGLVWRIPDGENPESWFAFAAGEVASGPTGIAIDEAGDVLVVTSMALQEDTGRGLIQRIRVRADGTAGQRTTVARTDPASGPVGLAVTPDGAIVVALTQSNVLVLLGPDGTERARLTAEDVSEDAEVPLDGPTGVAIRGRSVVVTNQSPTANDSSHWVVFQIPLVP